MISNYEITKLFREVNEPGYTYVLKWHKEPLDSLYKIGYTKNKPKYRISSVISAIKEKMILKYVNIDLECEVYTNNALGIESYLHGLFEKRHKPGIWGTEWHNLTKTDVDWIKICFEKVNSVPFEDRIDVFLSYVRSEMHKIYGMPKPNLISTNLSEIIGLIHIYIDEYGHYIDFIREVTPLWPEFGKLVEEWINQATDGQWDTD